MSILTTRHRVLRYRSMQDFSGVQVLYRETLLFGFVVWSTELDREDVPSWALISLATLGYHEWKSRLLVQYDHLINPSKSR